MSTYRKEMKQGDRYYKRSEKLYKEFENVASEATLEFHTNGNTKKYNNLKLRAKALKKLESYYFHKSFKYYFCK